VLIVRKADKVDESYVEVFVSISPPLELNLISNEK
jgi:hypothetical protein